MRIRVLTMGKTNTAYVKSGLEEFLRRLSHYCKFEWDDLTDVRHSSKLDRSQLKIKEGEAFLSKIDVLDTVVLLDENGKHYSSVAFAEWLEHQMMHGSRDLVFIIGGAYGFSDACYARANARVSLSNMTFNHQMVRLIFAEQLYRAFTIQRGEPYHHS